MGQLPRPADDPQPVRALQLANRVRSARALLKKRLSEGQLGAAEVILTCPPEVARMPVAQLLAAQPGWGQARSRTFLARLYLPENKQIGSLTDRQRRTVVSLLTATAASGFLGGAGKARRWGPSPRS